MAEVPRAIRGQVFRFIADPFVVPPSDAFAFDRDGVVVIEAGRIAAVGAADAILPDWPGIAVERFADDVICPGFVDCHIHFPQLKVIASYGAQLMEWLSKYTFPEEIRFADPEYCRRTADLFFDEIARNGTTSASVYATIHPQSVDALFAAAAARGVRVASGKMMMDRGAPDALTETVQASFDAAGELAARWHGRDRLSYVVSPRFAPTATEALLEAAAALWDAYPDATMQTHLSEQPGEISLVAQLFPDASDYLDVYEKARLVRRGANFGHAIHLSERERERFRETGAGISHCPSSNLFLGSGLFDLFGLKGLSTEILTGLGTDVAGGTSFSMLNAMRDAYCVAQLRGESLHPVQAYYLASRGSADVMGLSDHIGNLAAGLEADIVILDPNATQVLSERSKTAETAEELLFALMILGDDRAVRSTISGGRTIYVRDR